jgi:hypothetical protein
MIVVLVNVVHDLLNFIICWLLEIKAKGFKLMSASAQQGHIVAL